MCPKVRASVQAARDLPADNPHKWVKSLKKCYQEKRVDHKNVIKAVVNNVNTKGAGKRLVVLYDECRAKKCG